MKNSETVQEVEDTDVYINSIKGIKVKAVKEKVAECGVTINDLLIFLSLKLNHKLDNTD